MPVEYSRRSPAVKRLMKEAQELKEPTEQYFAQPLEENLFEWHFTVRGPPDSDFANGVYHGRITLPPEYPMKPPSIMLLTPTGRFEVGTKICLSISGHHPETWQPSWSIRTVLLAIIGFMPTKGEGAIGSLDYTSDERKVLARRSQDWKCETCGTPNRSILPPVTSKSDAVQKEAAEIAAQIQFKKEEKKTTPSTSPESTSPPPVAPANNQPVPAPAPIPPNVFNMWNQQQGGVMPLQPPFNTPFPPNFMMPGQAQAGPANLNPQTPVGQTVPVSRQDESASSNPANVATSGSSSTTNESHPVNSGDQPESLGATAPGGAGLRQRTGAASRTNIDTTARVPATSQNVAAPRTTLPQTPVRHSSQSILCPLVTMSIFSLVIIVLIFRRIYVTYSYKFT